MYSRHAVVTHPTGMLPRYNRNYFAGFLGEKTEKYMGKNSQHSLFRYGDFN